MGTLGGTLAGLIEHWTGIIPQGDMGFWERSQHFPGDDAITRTDAQDIQLSVAWKWGVREHLPKPRRTGWRPGGAA